MSECSSKKQVSSLEAGSHSRDCVIRTADGGEFRAPCSFLSALSPVFQVVFSVDYGGRRDVLLTDVSASTMTALLRYYTSNTLRLNEDNVTEVLVAADMLLMDEARNCCLNYMLRNLKIKNCLGMAALAQWFYCPEFKRLVLSYAREHFDQVWRTSDEFPGISEALLVELLTSNELRVRTETDVLHSIVRWYSRNASPVKAGADLFRLLESVRVGLCQSLEPTDCCHSSPTLAGIDAYNAAVLEAQQRAPCLFSPCARLLLQYAARSCLPAHVATPSDEGRGDGNNADVTAVGAPARPGLPTQVPCGSCGVVRNLERWLPRMPYQMLFVVGGFNECGERDTVETYDPKAGRWLMSRMQGLNPRPATLVKV
ncbi:kelch-like protein 10 [Rhipicephalus microplus]|uniref:kelch-like protein 10 n=1 Tax=Rhipicephalus microplus TaxID=6941 RepID=UPI003F6B38A7